MTTRRCIRGVVAVLVAAVVSACSSLQQDVVISSDQLIRQEDILAIETGLAALDADTLNDTAGAQDVDARCKDLLAQIDAAFDESGMQKALRSRLYALQGRVYLIQGKKAAAKKSYDNALKSSKGDAQATVLGFRLNLVPDIEDRTLLASSNQSALLVLEAGLSLYAKGEYLEAVARMDEAFLSLEPLYKDAYRAVRDDAWNLRSVQASEHSAAMNQILTARQITLGQAARIAQSVSPLLAPYAGSGGTEPGERELFRKLVADGYFTPVSARLTDALLPAQGDDATRILCARFLWNLYCSRRGERRAADRYSTAWRASGEQSPVADVPVDSADFDAVLGCIENEIMELTDGVRFEPDRVASGVEFRGWVSRIR